MSGASVRLDEICELRGGGKLGLTGADFVKIGTPAYGAAGINGFVSQVEYRQPGVVLSSIGARCGKCFIATGEWTTLANTQVILPDLSRVDARFLWHQLNDEKSWHRSGTAQPFIKPSDVKARNVYLPPIAEQRRISNILDRADALRALRSNSLVMLSELTQSIFVNMFGNPNKSKVQLKSLGSLVDIQIGPFGSLLHAGDYIDGGVPLVNPMHIVNGEIAPDPSFSVTETKAKSLELYRIRVGDVILGRRGEMGRCGVAGEKHAGLLCGTGSLILRPQPARILPKYLSFVLGTPQMKSRLLSASLGATLPNLNRKIVGQLSVPVPTIRQQAEFILRLESADNLRSGILQSLQLVGHLVSASRQQAFAGRL